MSKINMGINYNKSLVLKDINNDTLFVNLKLKHFMIKDKLGDLRVLDVDAGRTFVSTEHSDTDECTICTENYTEFALNAEKERLKLIESQKVPSSEFYSKHGIEAIPVQGSCWFSSKATLYKVLDDVKYIIDCTDCFGEYQDQQAIDVKICFDIITSNYHKQIKEVYDYLKEQDIGDIWVLISSHPKYQQLFMGNSTGYLCSMWFGDKHPVKTVKCKVEWDYNEKYFDNFKSKLNVEILK